MVLNVTSCALWAWPFNQHALLCGWPLDTADLLGLTEELGQDMLIVGWWATSAGHYGSDRVQLSSFLVYGTYGVSGERNLACCCCSSRGDCAGDGSGPNSGRSTEWS